MAISVEQVKGQVVVSLGSDLTPENLGDITGMLEKVLQKASRGIVLDLECVGFISSMALGRIVGIHIALARRGASLVLTGVSREVLTTLQTTRLDKLFPVAASRADAIVLLTQGPPGTTS